VIDSPCTACGFVLRSSEGARGRSLPCPKCRQPIVIGGAAAAGAPSGGAGAPPPPVRTEPLTELRAAVPGATLVVACPAQLVKVGEWLLGAIAKTPDVREGWTSSLGVAPITLKARAGELWVCEPDLGKPGEIRSWDVFDAMILLAITEQVHQAAGVPPGPLSMDGMVLSSPDAVRAPLAFLRRYEPSGRPRDTGWFLQPLDGQREREPDDRSNLVGTSVYRLYTTRPALLCVMGLPVGWAAVFERHALKQVISPDDRVVFER
jgi:hypothetical protein